MSSAVLEVIINSENEFKLMQELKDAILKVTDFVVAGVNDLLDFVFEAKKTDPGKRTRPSSAQNPSATGGQNSSGTATTSRGGKSGK